MTRLLYRCDFGHTSDEEEQEGISPRLDKLCWTCLSHQVLNRAKLVAIYDPEEFTSGSKDAVGAGVAGVDEGDSTA